MRFPLSSLEHRVAGALVGFSIGALLTAVWYPRGPITWETVAVQDAFSFLSYASLPLVAVVGWFYTPEDWESYIQIVMLVGPALNGLFMGAGVVCFIQRLRTSSALRRAFAWALALEVPLILLLSHVGIPSPFASPDWPAEAVTWAHQPGITLLSLLGLCCGYVSHLVISDFWGGPVQHPSGAGLGLLFASNVIGMVTIFCTLRGLGYRIRRVQSGSAAGQDAAGDARPGIAPE